MDRLDAMSIAVAVVDTGSLSAAGRKLGIPLATVSRKVSELEKHLQARLFYRAARRITLTQAGVAYVAACRRVLEEIGDAERAVAGEYSTARGKLLITAPLVFGRLHVLPTVTSFLKVYPEVDIQLALSDRVINLLDEHVDLALRIGELPESSFVAARLGAVRLVTCASPAYLAKRGIPKDPTGLSGHDCITFGGFMSPEVWTFRSGRSEKSVRVHSRLVVSTAEAAIDASITGAGITRVLSYQIAGAVAANQLEIVLEAFESAAHPVHFVYARAPMLPLKLRAFLDYAAPRLRAALQPHLR